MHRLLVAITLALTYGMPARAAVVYLNDVEVLDTRTNLVWLAPWVTRGLGKENSYTRDGWRLVDNVTAITGLVNGSLNPSVTGYDDAVRFFSGFLMGSPSTPVPANGYQVPTTLFGTANFIGNSGDIECCLSGLEISVLRQPDGTWSYDWTDSPADLPASGGKPGVGMFLVRDNGATFRPLGLLPGSSLSRMMATGISADGRVASGQGFDDQGKAGSFRWTDELGISSLASLPGPASTFGSTSSVSANGLVIVGSLNHGTESKAVIWHANESGDLAGSTVQALSSEITAARGVSADGNVVVGLGPDGAIRWTAAGGVELLGPGQAKAASADGRVVIGDVANIGFRWTEATGMQSLGTLPGGWYSNALGVSGDGTVVVGYGSNATPGEAEAFRWTAEDGMVGLGAFPGHYYSLARAVSADGSVVVGESSKYRDTEKHIFIWTEATGMRDLVEVLVANGATGLTGWKMQQAVGISANGRIIAVTGINPQSWWEGFVANIQPMGDADGDGVADHLDNCIAVPNPDQCDSDGDGYGNRCDGDLSNNGFTNGQDVALFRQQLGQPSVAPLFSRADLNCNGVVDDEDALYLRQLLGRPPGPSELVP